ncbi:ankyrin repeat, PH and SEC7 domain containing protein secG-like [Cotesia glomerata]|uniref:ankyrin repeat, PH and SEC7 domain containing protein secG-like n=1 Tax=Cotesia glomerata TaxID=32391 RepID=UPI001D009F2D|nr:ankyrin repeat, PH and SEC7 domain containing protein secG-like [Cotesia glomerata]
MASAIINLPPSTKDPFRIELEIAIDEHNENRVKELIGVLKERDEESGCCTLGWDDGYHLLRHAIQKNRAITNLLLDYGVKTNRSTNQACKSPLHFAVENRDLKMVEKLLSKGAKTRAKTSNGRTPLYLAVEVGNKEIIELLLEKDPQPALNEKNKLQPIEVAAEIGEEKVFNMLINKGAKANLKYCDGTLMLHVAVENGYERTVSKIIDEKNYDITDSRNLQLLTAAVMGWEEKYKRIVSTLVNAGFKIDPERLNDAAFIHKAADEGYCTIIEDLLTHGADPNIINAHGDSLLMTACGSKKADLVKTLIRNNADINLKNSSGHTVLYYVIRNLNFDEDKLCSHIKFSDYSDDDYVIAKKNLDDNCTCHSNEWFEILKIFIDLGLDVNNKDQYDSTALHYVIRYNYNEKFYHYIKELTCLLLKAGADAKSRDNHGNTPLQDAISSERLEIVELLLPTAKLDDECYINCKKQTLLHAAAESRGIKLLEIILKQKEFKNLDLQDINGATPLSLAVQRSCFPAVEILLLHGANPNLADVKLMTPLLHNLERSGPLPILEILLKFGANINCVNKNGMTPLTIAASYNNHNHFEILVKYATDLNARVDRSGRTALHCAAQHLDKAFSKLLKLGADINIMDYKKKTALDYLINSMVSFCEKCEISLDPSSESRLIKVYTRDYIKNVHIYLEHVAKLQLINSFVCPENLRGIYMYENKYGWIHGFKTENNELSKIEKIKEMYQEVESMKQYVLENTNINVYQILTKCPHRIAKYVLKNNNVIQQLQTPVFVENFPVYGGLLSSRIKKCLERKKILDDDTDYSFHRIFPSLPSICIDEILSYLSNYDLKILINVCQLTMYCQDIESNVNLPLAVVPSHIAKKQKI